MKPKHVMLLNNFHPGVRLTLVLASLTAVFSSNIWLIVFAIFFLTCVRLPDGLRPQAVVVPVLVGVVIMFVNDLFFTDTFSILPEIISFRLGLIVILILISAMLYKQNFTSKEWLVAFALFHNRKLFVIASFLAQMTRAFTIAYDNIHIVFREILLRPRMHGIRAKMLALPGIVTTFFIEIFHYIEIYADTWSLRLGSSYLDPNIFLSPLTNADKLALIGALSFVIACLIL